MTIIGRIPSIVAGRPAAELSDQICWAEACGVLCYDHSPTNRGSEYANQSLTIAYTEFVQRENNVRFGSKADIRSHVRFTPEADILRCDSYVRFTRELECQQKRKPNANG